MTLKKALKDGKVTLGTWITINHPDVVDALSDLNFDWICFDLEHAPIDPSDLEFLLMPLKRDPPTPMARLSWNDQVIVKRVLDMGVKGLVVPMVNTREDAERMVKYASYPPRGIRGAGPRRCIRYGELDFLEYYGGFEENERVLIAQIETPQALENLEEIASTPGVDALFIGPFDLTVNLGIPTQYDNPKFEEAKKKVLKVCEKYDIAPGIHALVPEMVKQAIDEGFRFVAIMNDMKVMKSGFKEILIKLGRLEERAVRGY